MESLATTAHKLLDLYLNPHQQAVFRCYEQELIAWNQVHNLTAITLPGEIRIKHFLDSLSAIQAIRPAASDRLIDVGTGAGFPGIPLKIIYPKLQLTLVESVGKKADFCQHMVDKLHLENVSVIKERAEEIGQDEGHRERYDWAVARAVAVMPILAEYLLPLVRVGGRMVAMKGETGPAETHAAESALGMLGGRVKQIKKIELPGVVEERYLVTIEKVAATPVRFPRRTGIPKKRPLT
jgi:16S rRNA (guanine527-N7)-methyltransferase